MSGVIVQKYGGSSLASSELILKAARRIADTASLGKQVAVVVSAMGRTTDRLIETARSVTGGETPSPREMDTLLSTGETASASLVAMALQSMGRKTVSLTGFQAGIRTDNVHMSARIASINAKRVVGELNKGRVVTLAGFQGYNTDEDITTLGRGGSDTTAVAMAVALKAERCEIYTDVKGIYTADPRLVPTARKMDEVDFEEMLELASLGSKMNPRSIELAAVYKMPIYVASSFLDEPGTLIHSVKREVNMEVRKAVTGIAVERNVAKITVGGVEDRPGIAADTFSKLSEEGISVDVIVQNTSARSAITDITFTVSEDDYDRAVVCIKKRTPLEFNTFSSAKGLAKVSIVGTGMQNSTGYAATMFQALGEAGANIDMITTSEIRITCIIANSQVEDAARSLHKAFDLDSP